MKTTIMLRLAYLLFGLLFLFTAVEEVVRADEGQEYGHVLVLDASNFTHAVEAHPFIVVEFYAPWCGHCKRLAPEYEKAAAVLKTNDPPIILAKIDANHETNKGLASEYNVRGFPTLKILEHKGASVRDYKGPRDADGIVSYLKKQAGPPSQEIISAEQGQRLAEQSEMLVVGVFSSYESEEFKNFTAVANELRSDFDFYHTNNGDFLPSKPVPLSGPTIRLYKKFDEGFNDLKDFFVEGVKKFLDEVSIPSVVMFNKDPAQRDFLSKIFSNPLNTKVFLFVDSKADGAEEFKSTYVKLAHEYKGKGLRFLMADIEEGQNAVQYFGVKKEKLPSLVVQGLDEKKYMLEEAEVLQLASWLQDYIAGKVPEFIKSEPIPEQNDELVKVVVADSLEEMVLKSAKNVLIEFYAPWCGHCKKLAPILEEVAVSYQADPNVVIAKFDATANDIRYKDFNVKGFPTIYLYSAAGNVIPYEGDRSKEDILHFINQNKYSPDTTEIIKETAVDSGVVNDEL